MRGPALLGGALLASACSGARPSDPERGPGLTVPHAIAEGRNPTARPPRAAPPAPAASAATPRVDLASSPPDPAPLALRDQWEFLVRWEEGTLRVVSVKPRRFPRAVVTARSMGRFAVELWIGRELVERVRFDLPLLEAEAGEGRALRAPPRFAPGVTAERVILVPDAPRARRAVLVDRATGEVTALPWPPSAPPSAPASGTASPGAEGTGP